MNRFHRRRRHITGSIYGPARRFVDARYAAALLEVGYLCRTDDGAAFRRRLLSVALGRDEAPADESGTSADASPIDRVLAFHGELDLSKKASIERALAALERFAPGAVAILDLTDVQYLDTTFLNALLRANRRFGNGTGNRPRIVAPKRSMPSRILTLTKLDTQFDVFEDLASAQR